MPTVSGHSHHSHPRAIHLSVGWEIAVVSSFVIVIIAVLTVAICQYNRKQSDLVGIDDGARINKSWPASISNKRRRRRKKTRKTKARDSDVTINLESEDIEEVESFEEDITLQMDGVVTEGVSGSGQQHVDVPKVPTRCKSTSSTVR